MNDVKSLVPKDKFDNTTILQLEQLSDIEIQPIIYELLEWLQDYNWPISKEILPIILLHQNIAMPHIIDILEGDDVMWRVWIIDLVIPNLLRSNKKILQSRLEKIAALTDNDCDTKSLVESAQQCLNCRYTK